MRVSTLRSTLAVALFAALLAPSVRTQAAPKLAKPQSQSARERLDKLDHAERLKRIALTGDLGLPALPPVFADSPRDSLLFADRFPAESPPPASSPGDGGTPAALDGFIPAGVNGTGTTISEIFKYLLPTGYETYEEGLPSIPLVVAYHGYGASANSVAVQSTIDDECYDRGWAYLAPTGMDDQLFGSNDSQKNTQAAIEWMLDNFNIDPDRIYMVGFSMGGGVCSNFVARRRDPDGLMIAALGIVSGTFDWTMSWKLGNATLKTLLQSPFNFGGPPNTSPYSWRYQQASGLHYNFNSYPPLGTAAYLPDASMGTNLGATPTYIVWDISDTLPEVVKQTPAFYGVLQDLGGVVEYHTVTGSSPTHSWSVLNEAELFDFFEGKVVERTPDAFHALMDVSGDVSWMHLEQRFPENFSIVDGESDALVPYVSLASVVNAEEILLDMQALGLNALAPVRINAGTPTGNFQLSISGFDDPPAYMIDAVTGDLVAGSESDPLTDTLLHDVSASSGGLDALVVTDPSWTTDLLTGPNPVGIGAPLTLTLDAPASSSMALLFIGFTESLNLVAGGFTITLGLGPPTVYVALGLDGSGDASLPATMPNDAGLVGLTMLLQSVAVNGSGGGVESISNMWALHVE